MDPEARATEAVAPDDQHEEDEEEVEGQIEEGINGSGKDVEKEFGEKKEDDSLNRTKSNISIAETLSPIHEFPFIFIILMAQFMTQVALGGPLAIIHIIGAHYNITNPGTLSWLIAGYSLTVGTFILISGRFGDVFGYKKMLVLGFSWFSLWSLIAGLAAYSSLVLFIFARVLQGIGPSIILTNALAILGATYPPGPRKNYAFALFGAMAPIGSVIGSAFAGIFAQLAWWPWFFWSFAIALAACAALASVVVPDPPRKASSSSTSSSRSLRTTLTALDLLGGALGVTSLVLFNFAWNQSGVTGWSAPPVYVTLILSALLTPAFFYYELNHSPSPLIPAKVFTTDVSFVLACVACGWSCFGIWVYYIWTFLTQLRHATPLLAAAMLSPVTVSGPLASITTGFLLSRLKPASVMSIALTFFTVGTILIATTPVRQSYWAQTFVCTVIIPWGMDMSFPAATLILSNAVPKEHQGLGASLVNTVVNYSISLGLGFAGTVESHVNGGGSTPAELLRGYRGAWYMGIGLAGLGLVTSLVFLGMGYLRERRRGEGP